MLEEQIKQASNDVMKAVGEYLLERAKIDASVARSIEKESKSLKECFKYIVGEASKQQKEGCTPIKDDDVYGMAVHYYDEDDIRIESLPTGTKALKRRIHKMQKCKDCKHRRGNTCTMIKYDDSHGKSSGKYYVICPIDRFYPTVLQCKSSPRWCPLKGDNSCG